MNFRSTSDPGKQPKPIAWEDLLRSLNAKTAPAIKQLASNPQVRQLVLLQSPDRSQRKIIPVGPGLDFRTLSDASSHIIDGMKAVAYVDLSTRVENPPPSSNRLPQTQGTPKQGSDEIYFLRTNLQRLQEKVVQLKKQITTRDSVIAEMKRREQSHLDKIQRLQHELNHSQLAVPLTDLEDVENKLMERMNEFMTREAELEQREEDLFRRERMLYDKEALMIS